MADPELAAVIISLVLQADQAAALHNTMAQLELAQAVKAITAGHRHLILLDIVVAVAVQAVQALAVQQLEIAAVQAYLAALVATSQPTVKAVTVNHITVSVMMQPVLSIPHMVVAV